MHFFINKGFKSLFCVIYLKCKSFGSGKIYHSNSVTLGKKINFAS